MKINAENKEINAEINGVTEINGEINGVRLDLIFKLYKLNRV
jgi:hypothetical protein